MTARDAVAAATRRLREDTAGAARLRARHRLAFVDDAQELTEVEIGLLRAIFGERLDGVTLCGDPASAISLGQRTQPEATFALAAARMKLREPHRRPHVDVARPKSVPEEAAAIADRVAAWIESGVRPEAIAVSRSVRNVEPYEAALLDRNVPAIVSGDVNVFADRRALDALALLWNVHDRFATIGCCARWPDRRLRSPTRHSPYSAASRPIRSARSSRSTRSRRRPRARAGGIQSAICVWDGM